MSNTDQDAITITQQANTLADEATFLRESAMTTVITKDSDYQAAAIDLGAIKKKAKELDEERKSMTRPLDESKSKIMDWFRAPLGWLNEAERAIKQAMIEYQNEQERLRREEEARVRELARKEAEKLERRAEKARAAGHEEKAEALEVTAEQVQAPVVAAPPPQAAGTSIRTTYSAEVTDKMALIKAVAAGQVPDVILVPDMKILNAQARALKDSLAYPGVKVVANKSLASRAA